MTVRDARERALPVRRPPDGTADGTRAGHTRMTTNKTASRTASKATDTKLTRTDRDSMTSS
jgi:hypothetical protein